MQLIRSIQNRIYEIRGERVMLDRDLAVLYGTQTKVLNLAVKRNRKRFPRDFMFQLTREEFEGLRYQIDSLEKNNRLLLQTVTSKGRDGNRYLPYVFTVLGVAMVSGILNSDIAIKMNLAIMTAFEKLRRTVPRQNHLKEQFQEIKHWPGEHDAQLNPIYEAIENLLDEKAAQRKWEARERIGFKK
jgi:hypothetical protein